MGYQLAKKTDKIGEKFVQQRKPCDISKDKNTTG